MSTTASDLNLIPWPRSVQTSAGAFSVIDATRLFANVPEAKSAEWLLAEAWEIQLAEKASDATIHFSHDAAIAPEGYTLSVTPAAVTLTASAPAGWFYGVQTLLQLIRDDTGHRSIPAVEIDDAPRFAWRGLMLDVSRHLMPVDGICRLLDCMAAHKLNSFHWHLTDDQGWRIESKAYPKLTEIGAYRRGADGQLTPGNAEKDLPHVGTYGGFYTHDDVRKVVEHATRLHIRVMPEIEMPGHAMAALAAYPELSCTGGTFETAYRTGIFDDVYCAGNDATYKLLETVLDEILPLFPSQYIHVGGDECPKTRWKTCPKCQTRIKELGLEDEHELQSYVITRASKFLADRGRQLVGWDEILEGGLAPGATVMSWRGTAGGITAAQAGRDVVMSPRTPCYLDYRQAQDGEPYAIGNVVNAVEHMYAFEPIPPELTAEQGKHVLGLQGNIWTEYMPDIQHVEYMVWPRASALAEVAWTPTDKRDWADFARRVKVDETRLKAMGSNYRPIKD